MEDTKKRRTIEEALKDFVLDRYNYASTELQDRHDKFRRFYNSYRGTRNSKKYFWQSDYVIPSLKEALRIKIPLYLNIIFSNAYDSFDIEPGSKDDEEKIYYVKNLLRYGLQNIGKYRGGLYGQWESFVKQREMYGYTAAKVHWREESDKRGRLKFSGPDMETLDVFNTFPDPGATSINDSWVVLKKRDVYVSYLRMMEREDIYENIKKLKDSVQPEDDEVHSENENDQVKDRVELLEYHGEVPKSLLEGKYHHLEQVNPYEDVYVDAIITLANREVVIRRDENPYDCGSIFIEATKDRLPSEKMGTGTAEDIEAMAQELTNAHNKLSDCINIISNPMGVANPNSITGITGTVVAYPGKIFLTTPGVDNVAHAMQWMDTGSQAAALGPLINLIGILKEEIQRNTQAVPVISPAVGQDSLPETLGATMMIQANASEPIKHDVKHSFEPAFEKQLEIMLSLYEQFLERASAYKILGKEKAQMWEEEKQRDYVNMEDIALESDPTIIARGVSVFAERQVEAEKLMKFLEISLKAVVPALDDMGQPQMGEDGNPVMIPKADVGEIIKRIAKLMNFDNLEDLLPYLREERLKKQGIKQQGSLPSAPGPGGGVAPPASASSGPPNIRRPGSAENAQTGKGSIADQVIGRR